ncbi:hypothetical protein L9F63_008229, partial [Diploptera punctata]
GSETPEEHANYVWNNYVKRTNAKHIAIVAHSYGGCVALNLATQNFPDFQNSVFAIALTDSIHDVKTRQVPIQVMNYLQKVACNWVSDNAALGTPVSTASNDIPKVSAGSTKHELTSSSCFEVIFNFLQKRYYNMAGTSNFDTSKARGLVRVTMEQKVTYEFLKM